MKKTILLTLLAVAIGAVVIYGFHDKGKYGEIQKEIDAINRECPINMGMSGDMISAKFDKKAKEVKFNYLISEDYISVGILKKNIESSKKLLKLGFSDFKYEEMLKDLVYAEVAFTIVYKGRDSGEEIKFFLTVEDMKDILDNPITEKEKNILILETSIARESACCPLDMDDGIVMTKAYDAGENIIYEFDMDTNIYDIKLMKLNTTSFKDNIFASEFDDIRLQNFLNIAISLEKGLIYRYNFNDEYVDIAFTVEELKEFV